MNEDENRLLLSLPQSEKDRVRDDLGPVSMLPGDKLFDVGERVGYVYFPQSSVVAISTVMQDGSAVTTATIGREGVVGAMAALRNGEATSRAVVQLAGRGIRMEAARLREHVAQSPFLSDLIRRHGEALLTSAFRGIACANLHSVEKRYCRTLLRLRDRTGSDLIPITQDAMASLLGAQRSTITAVARELRDRGVIVYRRGVIECTDPAGLEASSCECYVHMRTIMNKLLPQPLREPVSQPPPCAARPGAE